MLHAKYKVSHMFSMLYWRLHKKLHISHNINNLSVLTLLSQQMFRVRSFILREVLVANILATLVAQLS